MKEIIQLKNYMAEPITPISELEKNQDDMKTQMELLIMRIQAEFCRALEKEEDEVICNQVAKNLQAHPTHKKNM